jgi:hypothetical protein
MNTAPRAADYVTSATEPRATTCAVVGAATPEKRSGPDDVDNERAGSAGEGSTVDMGEIISNTLFVVVFALVCWGLWGWRRGKVQRKSSKTALVFGLVAVVAMFIATALNDYVVLPGGKSTAGLVAFMVAMALLFVALIAVVGAIVSVLVRLVRRGRPDTAMAITAPPPGAQSPSV